MAVRFVCVPISFLPVAASPAASPKARSRAVGSPAARLLLPLALAAALGLPGATQAQTLYTDSGTFTWGTNNVWSSSSSGPFTSAWSAYDYADFKGTAGTVTVSGVQKFNGMQFEASGYVLNAGTLQIGSPASPPAYFNVVNNGTPTINSALEGSSNGEPVDFGSSGYTGTVILTGPQVGTNFNTRTFNVQAGILNLQNTALGTVATNPVAVSSGATLQLQNASGFTFYNNLTLNGGAGTSGATGALENVSGANTVWGASPCRGPARSASMPAV